MNPRVSQLAPRNLTEKFVNSLLDKKELVFFLAATPAFIGMPSARVFYYSR